LPNEEELLVDLKSTKVTAISKSNVSENMKSLPPFLVDQAQGCLYCWSPDAGDEETKQSASFNKIATQIKVKDIAYCPGSSTLFIANGK
jgi:hypothetical protein